MHVEGHAHAGLAHSRVSDEQQLRRTSVYDSLVVVSIVNLLARLRCYSHCRRGGGRAGQGARAVPDKDFSAGARAEGVWICSALP